MTVPDQQLRSPIVSVITPFYNTAQHLEECIQSVLRQTYANWEYILVDNQSTDGSREIADRFAKQDSRIRIVKTSEFLSQIDNYNFALTQISDETDYCKIVQADDWLFPECLEKMVGVAQANSAVGIVGSYVLRGTAVSPSGLGYQSIVMTGRDACRAYLRHRVYLFGSPTTHLIRADLVHFRNAFYDKKAAPFEDADVCFELLQNNDFAFIHQILSYSRRDNESTLGSMRSYHYELLFRLVTLRRWGPKYLNDDEMHYCTADSRREYIKALGDGALHWREHEYWDFQRKMAERFGLEIRRWDLLKSAAVNVLDRLGNPKRTLESLWARAQGARDSADKRSV